MVDRTGRKEMKSNTIESIIEKYIDENTNSIPITSIHAMCVEIANAIVINRIDNGENAWKKSDKVVKLEVKKPLKRIIRNKEARK